MNGRIVLSAAMTLCCTPSFAQLTPPDLARSLQSFREQTQDPASIPNPPAVEAPKEAPEKEAPKKLDISGEFLISVFPTEAENKVMPSKAWLDLVFTGNDRFKIKFSFDPRSMLIAGPAREALRSDPDLRRAIEMGIKLKIAAAKGIPNPALFKVPGEVLDAAVSSFVSDKIDREAVMIASIQGLSVELNLLKGIEGRGRVDVEVGKMAPKYYDRSDYFHFAIPENAVQLTAGFNERVRVHFKVYKSRFGNLDERVIEDYIKTVVSNEDASHFGDYRPNAAEAGISFGDTLVAMGHRNKDSFYGVFQHERALGAGFSGRAQLTLEKGSAVAENDDSLIKRLNAVLERQFGKVSVYGQFFARRSPELSQPNVTATLGGASIPVTKHMDVGGNVGRINGGGLYEFTGKLHF